MNTSTMSFGVQKPIEIPMGDITLDGLLCIPEKSCGIVLFAHGSGSSRFSQRNQFVAHILQEARIATLLFDLLTPEEEEEDEITRALRFNIEFLTSRLINATEWIKQESATHNLPIGYFGASTGGAAALVAASREIDYVKAVVSRGGRPDLADESLHEVKAPTLLIVGGKDDIVIELNQQAYDRLNCVKQLQIVPGATHLFEEPGTLDQVAVLAREWFLKYLS